MNKVFAYRNLNRKGIVWSIKDCKTGLVIERIACAYFKDVDLKVSQAGRERVLLNKRKNVHAGVKGIRVPPLTEIDSWIRASYNPYKNKYFTTFDGTEVKKCKYAALTQEGLFISGVEESNR